MEKPNDIDIRKLHLLIQEELQTVVRSAIAIGGVFGLSVSLVIAGMTDIRRLILIIIGCLFGYYTGKLRKQDLYEKSLILFSQLSLLDAANKPAEVVVTVPVAVKEPEIVVAAQPEPQKEADITSNVKKVVIKKKQKA